MDVGKKVAGEAAARLVQDGMVLGLGTGSTVRYFIEAVGRRAQADKLGLRCVCTSAASEALAQSFGLETVALTPQTRPNLTVDGADEANPRLDLIKGGGGALVREKLVAAASEEFVVIADATKRVKQLGAYPLPVAVVPFAAADLCDSIRRDFEVTPKLRRTTDGQPLVTDDGLFILDLAFDQIPRPAILEKRLKLLVGVVECGLFVGLASRIYYGSPDGRVDVAYPVT